MSIVNLRLPASLHEQLKEVARQEGISMNQYVLLALAEKIAVQRQSDSLSEIKHRAARGSRDRFLDILNKSGNNPPQPGDELPPNYKPHNGGR